MRLSNCFSHIFHCCCFQNLLGDYVVMSSHVSLSAPPDSGCVRGLMPHHSCILAHMHILLNIYNPRWTKNIQTGWLQAPPVQAPKLREMLFCPHHHHWLCPKGLGIVQCISNIPLSALPQPSQWYTCWYVFMDWGIKMFRVKLQPQEGSLKRICQTPLHDSH